ncbi:UNKNOWN [Stylonychia lemnae]|uniref:GAF domain-containing protein n=1 Tax=Stylonychia lemnae TaxID=5949 RepID=A0A078AQP0_STYLE|nr:UNKNOWN [Stylonychia lemnae]|eukprot:CDW84755.1 UNKNOWN [Stylonychia lemnae]
MSMMQPKLNNPQNTTSFTDTFQNVIIKKSAELPNGREDQSIFPVSKAQYFMNQKIKIDQSVKKQSFSFASNLEEHGRNLSIIDYEKQLEDRFRTTFHVRNKTYHQFPDNITTPGPAGKFELYLNSTIQTPITTNPATISQSQNYRKSFQISTNSHHSNFTQLLSNNTNPNASDYKEDKPMNIALKNFKQIKARAQVDELNTSQSSHFRNLTADPINIRKPRSRRIAQIIQSDRKSGQKNNIDIESGEINQKQQDKLLNQTFTSGRNNISIYENEETGPINQISSFNHSENKYKFNSTCYLDQKNQILKEARKKEQQQQDKINELEANLKLVREELTRIKEFAKQYVSEMIDQSSVHTTDQIESQDIDSFSQIGESQMKKNSKTQPSALEVHRLYHDLYLTDLKSDIECAQKEVTNIRQDKVNLQKKYSDLKKENQDLKNNLKRYRTLLLEQEKKVSELQVQLEKAQKGTGVFQMKLGDQSFSSLLSNPLGQNHGSNFQNANSSVQQSSRVGTTQDHNHRRELSNHVENASLDINSGQINLKSDFSFSQALQNPHKTEKLMQNVHKDDFEDNKIGTPMLKNEELLLKQLTLTQKLDQLSRFSKVILGSNNLKHLFNQLRLALKTIFRCESAYFLLHKKQICKDFKEEKGLTTALRIENEWFEGVIHDVMKESENVHNIKIEFNQKDIQGGIVKGPVMCWPVFSNSQKNSLKQEEVYLIIQVNGYKSYCYKAVDGTIMNIISKIVSGAIDSIQFQRKSTQAVQRSFDILDIFKTLLSERNHALLFWRISTLFPKLFNFKDSGVLFMDVKSKHLYSITSDDYEQTALDLNEENIVRYPNNIGLTGIAIAKKDIVVSQAGYKDRQFAPEVDNYININKVNNMLIGAMVDRYGEVNGVLQLINKSGADTEITEQDMIELKALLPALGEIIRTADESMEISRLRYAVFDKNKDIGQNNLAMLDQMMRTMKTQITNLVNHKKEYVFGGDKGLVQDVFLGLKVKLSALSNEGKGGALKNGLSLLISSANKEVGLEDELGQEDAP